MDIERIKYERTGGFTGMRIAADIEPNDLPEEQAQTLLDLLDDLDFPELPEFLTGDSSMPDQFTYTITVESQEWKHTVVTSDESAPEKMQELLQILNRIARKKIRKQ
ncbi:MAG TPA: protealysin inhibitor emfourin [Anaerolineales bacterium]|nr:protealysin inhibitor emfourin [Anaerolineales bacterium]